MIEITENRKRETHGAMDNPAIVLITIGSLLLLGLAVDAVGRFTRLPRVTLLLGFS